MHYLASPSGLDKPKNMFVNAKYVVKTPTKTLTCITYDDAIIGIFLASDLTICLASDHVNYVMIKINGIISVYARWR